MDSTAAMSSGESRKQAPPSLQEQYATLSAELRELDTALDVDTTREYAGSMPLRTTLHLAAGRVSHEMTRFALVTHATERGGAAAAADAVALMTELTQATAVLTSAAQLITRRDECGRTLRHDIRGAVRGILRSVSSALAAASSAATERSRGDALVYHAGMAMRLCADVVQLPTSDMVAVKRRVLSTATSA